MASVFWILPLILLCGCVVAQDKNVVIVEVPENKPMEYYIQNITMLPEDTCSILTPISDQPHTLYPITDELPDSLEYFYPETSLSNVGCGFKIKKTTVSDTGKWRLTINSTRKLAENNTVSEYVDVRVIVTTRNVVPKEAVTIVSGQDLYLRFENYAVGNLMECRVNWTAGKEIVLRPGIEVDSLVSYWGSGLKEECGVRARGIGIKDGGVWKLLATNTSNHVISGKFSVQVLNATTYPETEEVYIERSYATLYMGANNSRYCQARLPNGTMGEPIPSQCAVKLNSVTKASEGTWRARYSVRGQVEELQTSSNVQVVAVEAIHATVTASSRIAGALDLLCRWTTYQYSNTKALYCRFTRPDGVALSMEDGVGNANYIYFGDGLNFSPNIKYCGLTILRPSAEDDGTWQCVIGGSLNMLKSSFVNVPIVNTKEMPTNSTRSNEITVTGGEKDMNVKSGTPLTIACRATATLTYCWFGHPNGTAIAPISTKVENAFYYSGRGLAFGECSLTITNSNYNDSGKWSCNMGVDGISDLQVTVTARVTDSNMVAQYPVVQLTGSDSVSVICQSVPHGISLRYCRFVRPDGTGFGFTTNDDRVMERYRYDGSGLEYGDCGLRINPVSSVDFGKWSCAALNFIGSNGVGAEGMGSFVLEDQRVMTGGAVTGIVIGSILAVILIGGVVVYFCKYKRR